MSRFQLVTILGFQSIFFPKNKCNFQMVRSGLLFHLCEHNKFVAAIVSRFMFETIIVIKLMGFIKRLLCSFSCFV